MPLAGKCFKNLARFLLIVARSHKQLPVTSDGGSSFSSFGYSLWGCHSRLPCLRITLSLGSTFITPTLCMTFTTPIKILFGLPLSFSPAWQLHIQDTLSNITKPSQLCLSNFTSNFFWESKGILAFGTETSNSKVNVLNLSHLQV